MDGDDSDSSDDEHVNPDELADKSSEAEDAMLKDSAAKEVGRIIRDEQDEIIKVEWASYRKYIKYAGGCGIILALNLILLTFIFCSMASNYYM